MASLEGFEASGGGLFKSISPLLWFLRLIGATPLHHNPRLREVVTFRWLHSQTFWFAFVTAVHLSFISAQLFGGVFGIKIDYSRPTTAYTGWISKIGFFIATFLLPKLILCRTCGLKRFFAELNNAFDSVANNNPPSSQTTANVKKMMTITVLIIVFNVTWVLITKLSSRWCNN